MNLANVCSMNYLLSRIAHNQAKRIQGQRKVELRVFALCQAERCKDSVNLNYLLSRTALNQAQHCQGQR